MLRRAGRASRTQKEVLRESPASGGGNREGSALRKDSPMPHPVTIRPSPYQPPTREQIERSRDMYV
ncbi:MAG TPA: hypothetical protein VK522_08630, partial [Pseudolabrys sp.]|nr:hypothetical protein [Pseudolabrys sp.]